MEAVLRGATCGAAELAGLKHLLDFREGMPVNLVAVKMGGISEVRAIPLYYRGDEKVVLTGHPKVKQGNDFDRDQRSPFS